jgi:hypothetical protein
MNLGTRWRRAVGFTLRPAYPWGKARYILCRLQPLAHAGSSLTDSSTLEMEAIYSSETSVHTRSTRRHFPEDGILHSHHCENLKSYKTILFYECYQHSDDRTVVNNELEKMCRIWCYNQEEAHADNTGVTSHAIFLLPNSRVSKKCSQPLTVKQTDQSVCMSRVIYRVAWFFLFCD